MRRTYTVMVDEATGVPFAHIDHHEMWDLVEYLSTQRTAVTYAYGKAFFIVHFTHLEPTAAQQLLDHWSSDEGSGAESSAPSEALHG